jgi:dihydroorotate dehydrogenase electron transfer subunit
LHKDIDSFRMVTIEDVIQETPTVKTFVFKDKYSSIALPGQFLMVWIPRVEELPISIMISENINFSAITIRKRGYGSTSLFNYKIGDIIGIRGPYGNSFTLKENFKTIILIGGGTGMVPLVRLLNTLRFKELRIIIIMGSRTKEEIFFVNIINKILEHHKASRLLISTEDGSFGVKGLPIDILNDIIQKNEYGNIDMIYTCGPELMMKNVYDIASEKQIPIQASLERYMKCGVGICSSCCINDLLVCYDGTIFTNEQLQNLSEFGISYRDKTGRVQKYNDK